MHTEGLLQFFYAPIFVVHQFSTGFWVLKYFSIKKKILGFSGAFNSLDFADKWNSDITFTFIYNFFFFLILIHYLYISFLKQIIGFFMGLNN